MSKKTIIQPVEKTKEIKEIPSNETFGIHEFKHDACVNSVSFSNDGTLLATGDEAKKTTIYDVK